MAVQKSTAFVKVSMDGAPYLRKVDLKLYNSYSDLSEQLRTKWDEGFYEREQAGRYLERFRIRAKLRGQRWRLDACWRCSLGDVRGVMQAVANNERV
ncbi:unnamed protein product [Linum tenue]|uniref:Auxin-responsive protein n=1 Tax=Linum tenue TaxID=586396 RepID=A0AAV0HHC0_9ROSI|nr:unnamed protein product [Linum tenue]